MSFAQARAPLMTASSVSFRIARHTEDLAQTIHALSQRVVQLEQRLAELEGRLQQSEREEPPAEQLASLAKADQLLRDCRELLAAEPPAPVSPVAPVAAASAAPRAELRGLDGAALGDGRRDEADSLEADEPLDEADLAA